MEILFRITLILVALVTTAVGITHWPAVQEPAPGMAIFSNPDGSPCERSCLFGVQPGLTSFARAGELLRTHHFLAQFEPNLARDVFRQGSTQVIIALGLGNYRVSSIELATPAHPGWGTFGQVIAVMGPPERVRVDGEYTSSFWREGQIEFVHRRGQARYLNPNDALERVVIQLQPNASLSDAVTWQGFTSVERYAVPRRSRYWLYK